MKKTLFLFLATVLSMMASAYDAKINGIYYKLDQTEKTASVTYYDNSSSNSNAYSGTVNIPAKVTYNGITYNVTSIGTKAFFECRRLGTVTVPGSVTVIGNFAFDGCTDLSSINIPNSVTSIESGAFQRCYGLTSVTIPNSVTSIGDGAFLGCSGLTSVHISDIAAWCKIAFSNYSSNPLYYAHHLYLGEEEITDLVIPNSVTSIGGYAFYRCSGLTSVTIPNSVTSLGDYAFYGCSGLTSVTIGNGVTSIGYYAFSYCSGLTSVTIGNGVTSIGNSAFSYCSGLTSVTIPNSVTSLGDYAFFNCSGLTSVTIGNGVTSIGYSAFNGCSGLTSVTIGNGVTSIGNSAFNGCSGLTSVTIPNSVTSVGNYAFANCTGLTSVTVEWKTPLSISSNVFSNQANATLYVPYSCKDVYGDAAGWNEFKEIVELPAPYEGGVVENGVYYLKNVETGKFLNQGNSWGTHAVLKDIGLPVRLEKRADGSYTITFTRGSKNLKQLFRDNEESVYVDYNGQANGCPFWTITNAEAKGTYHIQSHVYDRLYGQDIYPNTYLGNNPHKEAYDENGKALGVYNDVDGNVTVGMNITWELVSYTPLQRSQMLMLIELGKKLGVSTTQAEAALNNNDTGQEQMENVINSLRSTVLQRLADGVDSSLLPLDLTALIKNPSFISDDADGWEGHKPTFQTYNNAEFFQRTFNIYQTLTGLPIGEYQLMVKGFHRPGSYQDVYNSYKQGTNNASAKLYANSDSKTLANIARDAQNQKLGGNQLADASWDVVEVSYDNITQYLPNSMCGAYHFFKNDLYNNELLPINITDGCLTFGIRLDKIVSSSWVIFDDFRLIYKSKSCVIDFADANVKALCVANWDTNGDGELSEEEAAAVTDLGSVFSNNYKITSFNELQYFTGLTSIGREAFAYCSGLTSVTIPNSVTSIGEAAFRGCSGLTSVTIPNSVTSIGGYAFYRCSGLTSVTIGNGVTSIGYYAFNGCSGLTSVTIGNGVTSIGYYAFSDCSGLTSVTIPNSVTSLGDYAFFNCSGLTSVTIPNSVTSIGHYAFRGCSGLTSVTIPNSVTSIGFGAFEGCSGLTSVTIPNSVTSIGGSAFQNCSGLTSVTIPNSVTSIGGSAFQNCSGLTSVTIPNSVTSIGERAFYGCSGLTSVTIGNGVTSIGAHAFAYCSGTLTINCNIPSSLRPDDSPFKASKFTAAIFGNSVTDIGDYVFYECSGLTSLTIPNSVTSIGNYAFYGCSGLTSLTIPNSVTSIGYAAFYGCSGLTSLTIPNSVTSIGYAAFEGCSGLTSVTIPNSVTSIGSGAFYGCSGLTSVTIPNSVTSIGGETFRGCSSLTSVTIPNSVTSIGIGAFYGCSGLTSVTIPNSVSSIRDHAFSGCSGLTSVTVEWKKPLSINNSVFSNSHQANATLYVPYNCKAAYMAAANWNKFKEIIEIPSLYVGGDVNGDNTVDVADIASIISVMAGEGGNTLRAAADVNGDGVVDVADIASVIDIMAANARRLNNDD